MYKLCQIIFAEVTFKDNISAEIFQNEGVISTYTMIIIFQIFLTHVDLSALLKDSVSIILKPPFL